jgi:hypothetical protein
VECRTSASLGRRRIPAISTSGGIAADYDKLAVRAEIRLIDNEASWRAGTNRAGACSHHRRRHHPQARTAPAPAVDLAVGASSAPPFPAPWHTDLPKSADRGAGAAVSGEPFDLADVNRREATIGAGTGPFSRAPLPRSAAPPASTSPRYGTSRIRKHDTDSFHPCRRCAPAASSSCMLGTSANEQLTYNPRFTDVAASDRRCRCRSAHPSTRRSPNAVPLVH